MGWAGVLGHSDRQVVSPLRSLCLGSNWVVCPWPLCSRLEVKTEAVVVPDWKDINSF